MWIFVDTAHCNRLVNSTKPLALADSKTQRMTRDKISRPLHPNLPQNACCPCHILAKFRAVKTPFAMHTFDRSKVHLTWRKCCASKSAVAATVLPLLSNFQNSECLQIPDLVVLQTSMKFPSSFLLWPLETRGETKIGSDSRLISDRLVYYSASLIEYWLTAWCYLFFFFVDYRSRTRAGLSAMLLKRRWLPQKGSEGFPAELLGAVMFF